MIRELAKRQRDECSSRKAVGDRGGTAIVGTRFDDDCGTNSVAAYLFALADGTARVRDPHWQCDVDGDGQVNPVDSGIVQSLFGTCDAPREACP